MIIRDFPDNSLKEQTVMLVHIEHIQNTLDLMGIAKQAVIPFSLRNHKTAVISDSKSFHEIFIDGTVFSQLLDLHLNIPFYAGSLTGSSK